MVLKNVGIAIICTTLLAWGSASLADEYRPDEFLRLDLSKALLSPKPLGPASKFAPVAVEAKTDHRSEDAQARVDSTRAPGMAIAIRAKQGVTRRHLLIRSASTVALTGLGGLARPYLSRAADRPRIASGLASGDVSTDSAVVWSRADRPARMHVE